MTVLTAKPRIMASARAAKIAMPTRVDVAALSKPEAFDRWNAGLRAAATDGVETITIFDIIGEDFWSGGGVTVNRIDAALRRIGSDTAVEVHINSPGGDMFEGVAIYNRLLEHKGKVTVKVLGLAASAASIIAMAGDEILIGAASFLMIHNCWVMAMGNRHELAQTAEWLAPFDSAMADVYAARSGAAKADVQKWMDDEAWMNGTLAVERGLATGVLENLSIEEDTAATAKAKQANAMRQAEVGLAKSMSRPAARDLIEKIKGNAGAAQEPAPKGGGDDWLGAAAGLLTSLKA